MIYDGQLNELWQSSSRQSNSLIQYSPSIALANIVEQYFLVDNSQYLDIPAYILPDLSAHLLIHEIQDVSGIYFRFSLVGSRSKGFLLNRRNRKRTFIIRFAPGVLCKMLAISAQALNNQSLPLADFFPDAADQLSNILLRSTETQYSPKSIFHCVEQEVLIPMQAKLSLPNVVQGFVHYLNNKGSSLSVRQAAREIGCSERYLYKTSTQYLGMNPNKAIRVRRLLTSLEYRIQYSNYYWSDIAIQSGYADQSHLIAEYQEMLERTPRQIFQ